MSSLQAPKDWDDALSKEQPDHDPAIQGFLQCVMNNLTTSYSNPTTDATQEFVPIKVVEKYLGEDDCRKLNNILAALFPGSVPPVDAVHIIRDYLSVICILLRIGKARYISYFTSYQELSDKIYHDFYLRFCEEQWKFCVPVLRYNVTDLRLEPDTILPIIHKQKLNTGGSAVLYQITLLAAYDELRRPGTPKPSSAERYAHTFVLKTYLSKDAETYYNKEVGAFRHLKAFNAPNTNIIGFYGSYIHGETFNVILEFADRGSLARYFKETTPPSSGQDIINFWSSLFEVIPALSCIHDVGPDEADRSAVFHGWHQDIKPQNLLVASGSTKSSYECPIKLADLGISHFSKALASHKDATAREAHGTRTYGAPECYRSSELIERLGLKVSQKVDIWSLGCVFSEAAVWIVLGSDGIEKYRQKRMEATKKLKPAFDGGDCFHDGEEVLEIVLQMHVYVQNAARGWDHITRKVLETMVIEMLWPWPSRPNAEQLRTKSQKIIMESYERLNGVAHNNPFNETVPNNGTISSPNGNPREPVNAPPPPWLATQRATWDVSSSSRPLSGMARPPQRFSADTHVITDHTTIERQNSLDTQPRRVGSARLQHESKGDDRGWFAEGANGLGMEEIDEDDDEDSQPVVPVSGRRKFHVSSQSAEAVNHENGPLQASDELVNKRQSFKSKGRSDTGTFSNNHSFTQMGLLDGSASPPTPRRNKPSSSSQPQQVTPELFFAQALRYKEMKKKKKATPEEDLPFYWLLPRLNERDHAFLVDNSASMESHWGNMIDLFAVMVWMIKDADPDGMELYFTVSDATPVKAKHSTPFLSALKSRSQIGTTDINLCLSHILDGYKAKLHEQKTHRSFWKTARKGSKDVRPMNLYVFTDGKWESPADATTPIRNLVQKLQELGLQRSQFGIQFISFGNDPEGLSRLKYLDDELGLALDIVDTEPSNGNIWKMLLGSTNEQFDG